MSKKYRCVENHGVSGSFRINKVYELRDDGSVIGDDGFTWGPQFPTTIAWLEDKGWYKFEEVKEMEFTLADIKTGDRVTLRGGYELVAMFGGREDYFVGCEDKALNEFELKRFYRDDMTNVHGAKFDIVTVTRPVGVLTLSKDHAGFNYCTHKVMYTRDERKKMTVDEIEAVLGYKVAIVDEDGKEEK